MVMRRQITLLIVVVFLLSGCASDSSAAIQLSEEEMAGERLFVQNCASCHSTTGDAVIVGPSLAGIATRAESKVAGQDGRSYIETSILEPSAFINEGFSDLMPKTFGKTLTGEELDALLAYLLQLR
jgi:mono/diheme cytochrome c family protein